MLGRDEPAGQGKPDDVLQFGRERPERPERRGRLGRLDPRWRSRAIVACLVLVTALLAGMAFFVLLWRATKSLAMLTVAADAVGRGNLEPPLPASSGLFARRSVRSILALRWGMFDR